jgi:DNA repair exonuclease SbcCD nuclease subunit
MKVVILGDVHIGARNDSQVFCEYHISFFENQLFPYLLANNIKRVIQLGDIFDRRKFVNFQILDQWKRRVFDWFAEHQIHMDITTGNHDVYFKNTNEINSPVLLLREYSDVVHPFIHAEEVMIDKTKVLYVPWINSSNFKETMDLVKKTDAKIAMGHFEFAGFEMDKGHKHEGGLASDKFKKFDTVLSGHFHHKSDDGRIFYTGIPYQITWVDHGSTKGFHVWDSDTLDLEFIENPDVIFKKVVYDDNGKKTDYWKTVKVGDVKDKYIKVIVLNKKDLYGFDQFMSNLYAQSPGEIKIMENSSDFDAENVQDEDLKLEDTSVMLNQYIDAVDSDLDKDRLKKFIHQLYTEALNMEAV